ncbi:hypothetical protein [Streptomyces sp. NPDC127119]|uniref:hypothetical protein n=1 Tax=Streptomyces sp. NPDC127119 TaxID=3345370 RepID=UPI00363E7715
MTMEELVCGICAAAVRRGLRSGTDEARVRKWQRGTAPNAESQVYIAEALGWPADMVRADDWPIWLPRTGDGVIPLGDHSSVPALREALRTAMDRRTSSRSPVPPCPRWPRTGPPAPPAHSPRP